MPIENIVNQCQVDVDMDMARLVKDAFVIANQIAEQTCNTRMDKSKVVGQEPKLVVLVGCEQCIGHVGGISLVNGSLLGFNKAYDMVDVDDVMRVDVTRTNEEEAIMSMPKLRDGLEDGAKNIWPLRKLQEYHCLRGQHCQALHQHSSL
jgi:hypothetical protein